MSEQHTPGAGTPTPGGHPALTAAADQHLAELRDLVQLVRDHRDAHDCPPARPCPGPWAVDQVIRLRCHHRAGLLAFALAELAALGYGLPTAADTYWPADGPDGGA
ncbi:hypothetical protein AB0M91_19710 [Micromonospora rifamycinica]|uniref:hypothetical protein n=1 Tax=Micromonospora rifamycinica TaxID=291594 RepID=UPI003444DF2E